MVIVHIFSVIVHIFAVIFHIFVSNYHFLPLFGVIDRDVWEFMVPDSKLGFRSFPFEGTRQIYLIWCLWTPAEEEVLLDWFLWTPMGRSF